MAADSKAPVAVDAAPKVPDAAPVAVEQIMRAATEDAFVQGSGRDASDMQVDNSNVNFGKDPLLLVKYRNQVDEQFFWRESHVKFSLADVGTLEKATLRLRAKMSDPQTVSTIEVRQLTAAWEETKITWSNKPAAGAVVGRVSLPQTQPAVLELDVTAYVKSRLQAGATSVSFALLQDVAVAFQSNARIEVDSREAGATGPALLINHRPKN